MIDPNHITNYNLSEKELQYNLMFWLLVAGKTAKVVAARMQPIFQDLEKLWNKKYTGKLPTRPFNLISEINKGEEDETWLATILKKNGIGCHSKKSKGLIQLSNSKINLSTCSIKELENITSIGRKTSRCFILHTRPNAQCSGLDTHILKCMKDLNYDVPDSTPNSYKKYLQIEQLFLEIANRTTKTPANLDLIIWRVYSSHKHLKPLLLKILNKFLLQ